MASWKVGILERRDSAPIYNGMRYETASQAERAAENLLSRWMLPMGYVISESDDVPNTDANGEYIRD